jgi:hypothetical protein
MKPMTPMNATSGTSVLICTSPPRPPRPPRSPRSPRITEVSGSTTYFISEFQPNPPNPSNDPLEQRIELSGGLTDEFFNGCIWSVEADSVGQRGRVDRATNVSGTFDLNGLLVVSIPDLENPSFTIVLSSSSCPSMGGNVLIDTSFNVPGVIYDSIGVPDVAGDEVNLADIREAVGYPPGTDFKFTGTFPGDDPKLVFRDASLGDLYAVSTSNVIKNANGEEITPAEFSGGTHWGTLLVASIQH